MRIKNEGLSDEIEGKLNCKTFKNQSLSPKKSSKL